MSVWTQDKVGVKIGVGGSIEESSSSMCTVVLDFAEFGPKALGASVL